MSGWKTWKTPTGPWCGVEGPDGRMYLLEPKIAPDTEQHLRRYLARGGTTDRVEAWMRDVSADIPRAERIAAALNAGGARAERARRELP